MAVLRRRAAVVVVVGPTLVCVLAAGGCGGSVTDATGPPAEPTAATDVVIATPSPGPASDASPATPSPSPAPTPGRAPGPSASPDAPEPSAPAPDDSPPQDDGPAPAPSTTEPTGPAPSEPVVPPSPTPTPSPDAPTALRLGAEGPAVVALQERLVELGYWMPAVDGVFGPATHHAVVALQKAAGIARDGIVGPVTSAALEEGPRPQPRSTTGTVIEIDRGSQLLLLVTDGQLRWTFDTSTGRSGLTTPAGLFRVQREIDGYRTSPLGVLYRPKYFYRGIAMHGYPSVPPYPASHGCVRVTDAAMDWFWAADEAPIGRVVWVY